MANLKAESNGLINNLERILKRERIFSLPQILQVEISSACNLTCDICARNEFDYGPGNLPISSFESLTFLFPSLKRLILHGYGEPFAHPDFVKIMEIVAPYKCHKSFYTNGTLLSGDKARATLVGGIDEIAVSIDSTKKETFEEIRRGASFDKVIKNVGDFIAMRNSEGKTKFRHECPPKVIIAAVAMKDTVEDLPYIVDLARDLGADGVEINYLMAYKNALVERSLYFDKELSNRSLAETKKRAESFGLETRLPDTFTTEGTPKNPMPESSCPRPYDFAYVGYDGNIRPCCFPLLFVGNIKDLGFREIWNGNKYRNLRRAFARKNPPSFCRECLSGTYTHVDSEKCHISCI